MAYGRKRYRNRHLVENVFCRLKDSMRVVARYNTLAASFLSAVAACSRHRVLGVIESGA
ncbi:hypothetical protein GCM10011505_50130 [Tistrella bauzanensis]|uniref:Transposase DDE domain-containing protein n=1 Tax=Tistrella bauzanensis TaxID=657419 RepID=A0ABQ1J9Q1_9PROT|nr:hypothetical protein GCM10011505_50130 [Tistrella bauzanensis]